MTKIIYNSLNQGDILKTFFVDRTKVKNGIFLPYQKIQNSYRFCMLIKKIAVPDPKTNIYYYFLLVSYGTSQDITNPEKIDEIVLSTYIERALSNMSVPTKWIFSPANVALLPLNSDFFNMDNIKKGTITQKKIEVLNEITDKVEFKNMKAEIPKSKNKKMVEYLDWNNPNLNINKNRNNYKFGN